MNRRTVIRLIALVIGLGLMGYINSHASKQKQHLNTGGAFATSQKAATKKESQSRENREVIRAVTQSPVSEAIPLVSSPETQKRRVQREVNGLRMEYRRFLSKTHLKPEEQTALLELGARRALLALERSERLERGEFKSIDDADAYYKAGSEKLNDEMKQLLGNEYGAFWESTEKIPMQRQYDIFAALVRHHDRPIPQEQLDRLVDIGWEYYKAAGVDLFFSPQYSRVSSGRAFAEQMQKRATADSLMRKEAAGFLTDSQLTRLQSFQEQQIEGMYINSKLPQKKT